MISEQEIQDRIERAIKRYIAANITPWVQQKHWSPFPPNTGEVPAFNATENRYKPTALLGGSAAFGAPAFTLGTADSAGATSTVVAADSTIAAFDATVPVTQAFGDAAAAGSVAKAARRDHRHGMMATPTATGAAGGELAGTYPNPTVVATHSGSAHHAQLHQASHARGGGDDLTSLGATTIEPKTGNNTITIRPGPNVAGRVNFGTYNGSTYDTTVLSLVNKIAQFDYFVSLEEADGPGNTDRTIATGVITAVKSYHRVDTEAAAATDDLDTITMAADTGCLLIIRPVSDARTVVVKHNTGNIWLNNDADYSLDNEDSSLVLIYVAVTGGNKWVEVARSRTMPVQVTSTTGAIPVVESGLISITTAGAETRTLAAPSFIGQELTLYCKTFVGNCVVTCSTTVNEAGNNTITFSATGQAVRLFAVEEGSTLRWRCAIADGATLSTV